MNNRFLKCKKQTKFLCVKSERLNLSWKCREFNFVERVCGNAQNESYSLNGSKCPFILGILYLETKQLKDQSKVLRRVTQLDLGTLKVVSFIAELSIGEYQ
jgi:hypothetical protein